MSIERVPPWAPLFLQSNQTYTWSFFEELAHESAPSRSRIYVDDTCFIHKTSDVDGLLNHLNSPQPTIKFTMELEGGLPFFDSGLTRLTNGQLDSTVHHKKTHHVPKFGSHHSAHINRGMVRCLCDRAWNITQRYESLKEEENHLMKTFNRNGHPQAFVHLAAVPCPPTETD